MNTANLIRRSARIFSHPTALALACAMGLTLNTASSQAQISGIPVPRPIEELMVGQTVYTQPEGTAQIILGGSHISPGDLRISHATVRGEYGVTDRLQVQGEVPIDIIDQSSNFTAQSGVSRIQVGAMYGLMPIAAPVALSAGMDIEVPLASNDVTGDRPSSGPTFKPALVAALGAGPMVVHASTQAELGQPDRAINYSVGSMFNLGAFVPSLELNARSVESARSEYYVTPGLTYRVTDAAQIGAGASIGLNEISETQLMAKFSMQFGK